MSKAITGPQTYTSMYPLTNPGYTPFYIASDAS
jgi:hypothetical protein